MGEPLDLVAHEATRDTLANRLREMGFARGEVLANYTIPIDSPYVARVSYELLPDGRIRFGAIAVEGAERVEARSCVGC